MCLHPALSPERQRKLVLRQLLSHPLITLEERVVWCPQVANLTREEAEATAQQLRATIKQRTTQS